jgi:formylglycine-generating enzyme required for sulfatase activity
MVKLKQLFFIKFVVIFLSFLMVQGDFFVCAQQENCEAHLNKAKKDYLSGNYEKVIEKPGRKIKRKKKFPILLVAAGLAAVTVAVLLLTKKKDSTRNNAQEVYNSIEWIDIPAGEFQMGDNFNEGASDERPVHTVYLDSYKIARYELTFDQYDKFCDDTGKNKPSDERWGRGTRPVINVSWDDAKAFCDWLSKKTGRDIHLPTEAQWEKAARGTDQRRYPWGNSSPNCSTANYAGCCRQTKPVGSYSSGVSPYGVHDMAGNVYEWCSDWYSDTYYSSSPRNNPTGSAIPTVPGTRILRGGAWNSKALALRSTRRHYGHQFASRYRNYGFRLAQD